MAITPAPNHSAMVLLTAAILLACVDTVGSPSDVTRGELIPTILVASLDPATTAGAPYTIDSAGVESDHLHLEVSYAGGCRQHTFRLVLSTLFMESHPVQTLAVLSHEDNDDGCEAHFQASLRAALAPIKLAWQDAYQLRTGTVLLRLWTATEPITVPYTF